MNSSPTPLARGFELIPTRLPGENPPIADWETEANFQLPPKFRLFSELFAAEKSVPDIPYRYWKNGEEITQYCAGIVWFGEDYDPEEDDVLFSQFNGVEGTLLHADADDDWVDRGWAPVASCGGGGNICVGYFQENADQIFLETSWGEIIQLADDIFEFVQKLALVPVPEEDLAEGITFDRLYRNWGEDFWRVREV